MKPPAIRAPQRNLAPSRGCRSKPAGAERLGRDVAQAGVLLLPFVLAFTSGCGRSAAENAPAPAPVAAATYNASQGLRLSTAGAAFIAIETSETSAQGAKLTIPAGALLRTIKGTFVYVANGDWYLRTPVSVGPAAAGTVMITEGLYEGDRVVSRGTEALWLAEIHAVNGGVSCAHGH